MVLMIDVAPGLVAERKVWPVSIVMHSDACPQDAQHLAKPPRA